MMIVINNAAVFTPDEQPPQTAVFIDNGRFAPANTAESPAAQVIDASGLLACPGFIDLQINGALGSDFTADPQSIWEISSLLPRYGLTAYLPTIITSPLDNIVAAQRVLMEERPSDFSAAEPLGLHIEGPFINPHKKGAHNPAYIRDPDEALIADWSAEKGVRLVTLAPELPGAAALIRELAARDVIVSAGHSLATYDEAAAGFAAGVRYGTHLFNAMPPLGHREPGLPGALLDNPQIVAGIIPDGIHVHPALIRQAWIAKGSAGLNLVSDTIAALGMPPGQYRLNDQEVTVTESDCRLADGTLAGAFLSIDEALRNLLRFTGCTLSAALATITTTPARLLGIEEQRGRIAPGLIADLVLLTPDYHVAMTIANGRIVYQNPIFLATRHSPPATHHSPLKPGE